MLKDHTMHKTDDPQIYHMVVNEIDYFYNIISGEITGRQAHVEHIEINTLHCDEPFEKCEVEEWKRQKAACFDHNLQLENLCLLLSQDCNMRCVYCYEKGGGFGKERKLMDMNRIRNVINWWSHNLKPGLAKVKVSFYGGEPLLNQEGFIFAISYINRILTKKKIAVQYSVITNGTILSPDIINCILNNNVNVMVSIDGNETAQNRNRRFYDGRDSYELVLDNIRKLQDKGGRIAARITLTKENIELLYDSVVMLWQENIHDVECIPVLTDQKNICIDQDDMYLLERELLKISDALHQNLLTEKTFFFNNYMRIIYNLHLKADHYYPTCSYYDYKKILYTPDGEVYNCEKLLGKSKEKIGNDEKIDNNILKRRIVSHAYKQNCARCVARRACGGMCYADEKNHGEYMDILCHFQRMQFRHSLGLYIKMLQYDETYWADFYGKGI